jgi:hypothetical protein
MVIINYRHLLGSLFSTLILMVSPTSYAEDIDLMSVIEKSDFVGLISIEKGVPPSGKANDEYLSARISEDWCGDKEGKIRIYGDAIADYYDWAENYFFVGFYEARYGEDANGLSSTVSSYRSPSGLQTLFAVADDGAIPPSVYLNRHNPLVPIKGVLSSDLVQDLMVWDDRIVVAIKFDDAAEEVMRILDELDSELLCNGS